jgi:hypothetical protein
MSLQLIAQTSNNGQEAGCMKSATCRTASRECFKPFLRHLVSSGQSRKTLRSHRDNLWILGGEIISKLHEDPRLRKRPTDQIVLAVLDDEGGPLISHGSEDQQRSFDSTCRKFFRFLKERNTGGQ